VLHTLFQDCKNLPFSIHCSDKNDKYSRPVFDFVQKNGQKVGLADKKPALRRKTKAKGKKIEKMVLIWFQLKLPATITVGSQQGQKL